MLEMVRMATSFKAIFQILYNNVLNEVSELHVFPVLVGVAARVCVTLECGAPHFGWTLCIHIERGGSRL